MNVVNVDVNVNVNGLRLPLRCAVAAVAFAFALAFTFTFGATAHAAPSGFDHTLHARDNAVSGADDIACARCHRGSSGLDRPGHDACFAGCHGGKPAAGRKLEPICQTCHIDAKRVFYPPYTIDRDFALDIGHASHAKVACTACHANVAAKGRAAAPHARCAGCHDGGGAGKGFAMAECGRCHGPGIRRTRATAACPDPLPLSFAHRSPRRPRRGARACTVCHADIARTDSSRLPRPTTETCAAGGCHDGVAAFAATATCTRCHDRAPAGAWAVARPEARFVHAGSHQVAMQRACATCHPLDAAGQPQVAGHAACAECHAPEFSAREPRICGGCHNGSEPWRKLAADRPYPPTDRVRCHARPPEAPGAVRAVSQPDHGNHAVTPSTRPRRVLRERLSRCKHRPRASVESL